MALANNPAEIRFPAERENNVEKPRAANGSTPKIQCATIASTSEFYSRRRPDCDVRRNVA
ncbi:hypothetical protein StoSoilB13_04950 [Arthrobacter sp. StoSoilB13]|nr:hypothetical protein StoSoilB13_04950 [Arthrobacter sp. StoSoilB13]